MNDRYDDPSNSGLRTKLFREGKVVFLLPKKQASFLRSLSQTDIKLGMITRRSGWKNRIHARYLMVVGIIKVLLLSVRSQKTSDAFAFFAINKGDIRNVDEKVTPDGQVVVTFYKKSDQKILGQNLARYHKAAAQGDVDAQTYLGFIYLQGKGIPVDLNQAREWFSKAAQQGDPKAQTHLAHIYEKGKGIPRDVSEALKWYRQAAEQGYALAQYNLGVLYENGDGVDKNETEAAGWYRQAAKAGDAVAQFSLAKMYLEGRGVAKDEAEALAWMNRSAEQKNTEAARFLATAYEKGLYGCLPDPEKARYWRERSKEHGGST